MNKTQKPVCTVIIPVYNRERLVTRTLDSIAAQTYRPIEIITVDNGSTDESVEVVRRWWQAHETRPGLHLRQAAEPRRGAAAARRKGTELAQSDIIIFMDSDDTMRPYLVETAMKAFAEEPELEMVAWPVVLHKLDHTERTSHLWKEENVLEKHLVHSVLRTFGYAVRKHLIEKVGGWNPEMMVWNDWEIGTRLALAGPRHRIIADPQIDVYCQKDSITGTEFGSRNGVWEGVIEEVEKDVEKADIPDKARRHALRTLDYRRVILAAQYAREGHADLAKELLDSTLHSPRLNFLHRAALRWAYSHTSKGRRGAYSVIGWLL